MFDITTFESEKEAPKSLLFLRILLAKNPKYQKNIMSRITRVLKRLSQIRAIQDDETRNFVLGLYKEETNKILKQALVGKSEEDLKIESVLSNYIKTKIRQEKIGGLLKSHLSDFNYPEIPFDGGYG